MKSSVAFSSSSALIVSQCSKQDGPFPTTPHHGKAIQKVLVCKPTVYVYIIASFKLYSVNLDEKRSIFHKIVA